MMRQEKSLHMQPLILFLSILKNLLTISLQQPRDANYHCISSISRLTNTSVWSAVDVSGSNSATSVKDRSK